MKPSFNFTALARAVVLAACSFPSNPHPPPPRRNFHEQRGGHLFNADASRSGDDRDTWQSASAKVFALEGLGDLHIGQPVPKASSWVERGAQSSDACRTVSSPEFPGAHAIVEGGAVRRITIGQPSDMKLVEGIGVGSREKDVLGAFPRFRSEPHKYVKAPAKYLTAPNASGGDVALRLEISQNGRVSLMHVGTMPVLGYVEGCS